MPIVQSRVKKGVLTFGVAPDTHDFSCQPTNIRLTPTTNTEDPLETLCGDTAAGTGSTTWALAGTSIQDFDDPEGFLMHCFDHNGEVVDFSWQPNETSGTWTGQITVQALEIGGDVNTRITSDFTFPVNGTPVYTAPGPLTTEEPPPTEEPTTTEEPAPYGP
jgi:hypothetical protein